MEMVCILCPRGCHLQVEKAGEEIHVEGNFCPRGVTYAVGELTHPVRTVTTSVYMEAGSQDKMLSVKTSTAIAKEKIEEVLQIVKSVRAKAPVQVGDVIVKNIAETGADLVATRRVL